MNKNWFTVRNEDTEMPEISIVGYIGTAQDETDYASFKNTLNALREKGVTKCKMTINCGGGDMIEGLAIYDAARASGIKFSVDVIGMAASMGSTLMLLGDQMPTVSPSAMIMFHKPQAGTYGESDNLRDMAALADKLEDRIKDILTTRTGNAKEVVDSWFQPGRMTWMTANEAVSNKVACAVATPGEAIGQAPVPIENFSPTMSDKDAWAVYNRISNQNNHTMKLNAKNLADLQLDNSAGEVEINNAVAAIVAENVALKDKVTSIENAVKEKAKTDAKAFAEGLVANKLVLETERQDWEDLHLTNAAMAVKQAGKLSAPNLPINQIQRTNQNDNGAAGAPAAGAKVFNAADRKTWTLDDWAREDGEGLEALMVSDSAAYNALCKEARVTPVK